MGSLLQHAGSFSCGLLDLFSCGMQDLLVFICGIFVLA